MSAASLPVTEIPLPLREDPEARFIPVVVYEDEHGKLKKFSASPLAAIQRTARSPAAVVSIGGCRAICLASREAPGSARPACHRDLHCRTQ
jgi:hypothetical protein